MKKIFFALISLSFLAFGAHAADMPTFQLSAKDGAFAPSRLIAPANQRFMIEIHNTGKSPIEFESPDLRKEKAISPGGSSFIVINPTSPGEYKFFDDFHLAKGKGVIVIK